MYHHAGGLVDDHQLVVLIHNIKRNILGHNGVVVGRTVEHHRHHVERLDTVVTLHGTSAHMNKTGPRRLLNAVARSVGQMLHQEFVNAQQLLPLVGYQTKMLVQLPALGVHLVVGKRLGFI